MTDLYDEGVTLDVRLEFAIEEHERERKEAWIRDGYEEELMMADVSAKLILSASSSLTMPAVPQKFWRLAERMSKTEDVRNAVIEKLQANIAWRFCTGTDTMAERAIDLTTQILKARPAQEVQKSLFRLAKNYTVGFYEECLILCGLILEVAIEDIHKRLGQPLPATEEGKSPFRTRLHSLVFFNRLPSKYEKEALEIWDKRNAAAHQSIEVGPEVIDTIKSLIYILRMLYEPQPD